MDESLSADDVRRVAKLARLRLDAAQIDRYRAQLAAVLGHMDHLRELDLEGVEPLTHVGEVTNRLRDDEPGPTLNPETIASLAPESAGGYVVVPKVLGDGGGA